MDSTTLIMMAAFGGVTTLIAAIGYAMKDFGNTTTEDRLAVLTGKKKVEAKKSQSVMREEVFREGMAGISGAFNRICERLGNLSLLFEQADSPLSADKFFLLSGLTAALGAAACLIARAPTPLIPLGGIVGALGPWGFLVVRRQLRFRRFELQLPDALELIGRALRSGHSLASGLNVVVTEMPEPVCQEFRKAYEEQNLGIPIEQALKNMLKRVPNMDLKFFVTAVAIQRQSGGDLAEILDKISYIIRERFKILGQVKALTGEGRISGVVLMALPVALFFAVYYLNPDYVMLLFTEELGRKMVFVAGLLQVVGAVVIKKIVAIKV